ncbi:MAG: DUF4268 domain-containing protein [Chitinophagaceae bacterium]
MYTKREASQLRQAFWTAFGQYMMPLPNADGEKINWVNYKTGNRFIQVKMDAGTMAGSFIIEITHPDTVARQQLFQHFTGQQKIFESIAGTGWTWVPETADAFGKTSSMIYREIADVNIFYKEKWPTLIGFFKFSIVSFDEYWQMARYGFDV